MWAYFFMQWPIVVSGSQLCNISQYDNWRLCMVHTATLSLQKAFLCWTSLCLGNFTINREWKTRRVLCFVDSIIWWSRGIFLFNFIKTCKQERHSYICWFILTNVPHCRTVDCAHNLTLNNKKGFCCLFFRCTQCNWHDFYWADRNSYLHLH